MITSNIRFSRFSLQRVRQILTSLNEDYVLVIAALAIALIGCFYGEKIKFNGGFGMDGYYYGTWARDFHKALFVQGIDEYYIQRTLPSAIVHYSLRLFSIPLTNASIVYAFALLNVLLITLSTYVWCLIANKLEISRRGKFLGFAALFLNFAILKWPSYDPVLTDTFAFSISIMMLYFYLTNHKIPLFILTGLGAFIWPTLIFEGALFLIFPVEETNKKTQAPAPYHLNIVLALAVSLVIFLQMRSLALTTPLTFAGGFEPLRSLVHLSIAVSLLYLFFGLGAVWNSHRLFDVRYFFKRITRPTFFLVLLLLFGIKLMQAWLSSGPSPLGLNRVLFVTPAVAIMKPGIFYVSHVMFVGPILILALFWWVRACRLMQRQGVGLILAVSLGLLLGLSSESRAVINFFPLIIPFVIKIADAAPWRAYHVGLFGLISVIFSKVWLTIGGAPIRLDINEFGNQLFYMNIGPYMSHEMYSIQGTAVILSGVLFYLLYVRNSKRVEADTADGLIAVDRSI